jgi:hypothetical protein
MSTASNSPLSNINISTLDTSHSTPSQHLRQGSTSRNALLAAFPRVWQEATSDNTFTLHGFRRFRTSHLLNLRFLEQGLADLDRQFFQAGLALRQPDRPLNKLGLNEAKIDQVAAGANLSLSIDQESIDKLRELVARYGNLSSPKDESI